MNNVAQKVPKSISRNKFLDTPVNLVKLPTKLLEIMEVEGSTKIPTVSELVSKAKASFVNKFGCEPQCAAYGPGRVNLIGEHTDYNEGFVFPMVC